MKYNILYLDFARKTFRIGGGQVYLMNLLKGLDRTSFQPYIYSLSDGSIFQELPDVYVIPHGQPFDVLDQIDAKHLRSLLSPHKFYQFFLWLIYEIRHMRRIVQREDIDLIHINGILPLIVACFSGMTRRIPSVYHVHHVAGSRFVRWGVDFLCGTVNKVFCVSEYAKKETLYFHRKKGIVLYNGIEQGTAPCEKAKTIVFVGSMIRLKGYPEFITAIAEIQVLLRTEGYRIVCCGDGIDRPLIEQAIAVHGIGDIVQLKGFQKHVRECFHRARGLRSHNYRRNGSWMHRDCFLSRCTG